jgi:hypothetical protein
LGLFEVLALMAAVAIGLALDRAYAPSLGIILSPCVILSAMVLSAMRWLLPRLRWWPPSRLGMSLLACGITLAVASRLMDLVMRVVVGLTE